VFGLSNLLKIGRLLERYSIPILPAILKRLIFLKTHSIIPFDLEIGKESRLAYGGFGVLIVEGTKIGNNCIVGVNTAIIRKHPFKNVPIIGNNVYIGPGAIISGPVIIEDNVIVAANAVVNKSIKSNTIVAGVPAKIIGSINDLDYNIFENPKYAEGVMRFLE